MRFPKRPFQRDAARQNKGWRTRTGPPRAWVVPGIAVLVAGAALIFQAPQLVTAAAQGCVTPGIDGPNATLTGVVNTYYPATASSAAGTNTITVGPRLPGASPAIAAGDLLLVIQMQDGTINDSNTIAYGDGATGHGSTALNSSGLYEYVSAVSVVGAVITISGSGAGNGLVNSYDFSNVVTTVVPIHGFQTFQAVRVPQYSSATVTAGLTATPWNGALHAGGVLAIDVAGALNMNAQIISVNQLGFKGALGVPQGGGPDAGTDWVVASGRGDHGYKAEGIAGTPHWLYNAITAAAVNNGADGYPNGDAARGAPGNAGGGGTDSNPVANDQNSGGGGGGNGGQGGQGGNTWNTNLPRGGHGGAAFPAAAPKVVLGGGGGAGTRNNSAAFASSGGTGGGIVMIRTGSLTGAGSITANGGVGVTPDNDGGGGGGAGGSVVVTSNTGTVNGLTIQADGANGTDAWPAGPTGAANYHGPGGGGGGGVIITSNALPLAQTSVAGGVHGTTTVDANTFGSVSGSAGLVLTTTPGAIPGSSSGAECLPALTTAKTTSTPNVTNTVSGTTATYSITVSNAVNTGPATSVNISDALPAGFSYASTVGVVLNGGATRPATVNPTVGDTTPVFGTFTIPASGSVVITFTVNIAASVAPGTYNNPATATYLDPTRTTAGGTTTSNYAGGGAERVTVHAPDMTIAKTHIDPLVRGSTSTYTLTATNSGNVATIGTVTVTDTLPAGLTPTGAAGPGWTCPAPIGQTVTCTRSDALAGGASYPAITVTVTVLQTAPNSVTNQANVSGGGETNTTNDTASDLTNIVSQTADVSVIKTVNNTTPTLSQNVTYTIVAHNLGPSTALGVSLSDLLPAGVTFVSYTATQGAYNSTTGVWFVGTMLNGSTVTLSVVVQVTSMNTIVNTVTIVPGSYFDPNLSNNVSSATIVPAPALPDTSAPATGAPTPAPGERINGLLVTILTLVAGLGIFVLAGIRLRHRGRSRRRQHPSSGRFTIGLVSVVLSLGIASLSMAEIASHPTVASVPAGTQLIGSKIVDVAPPEPPPAPATENFTVVTGAITPSRLRIPSIGVDAWVGAVGLRSNGAMDAPNNLWTTSWLATGPRPGQPGNSVIAGHRGVGSPALFSHLENVKAGDRIYVSDAANNERIYVVTAVASMDLSPSTQAAVFNPTQTQQLVVITCFGTFLNSTRTYDHRLVVFSQPA